MCTHVKTSELIPALVSEIAEKRGSESFRIPEIVLWKTAQAIETSCWSNVLLSQSSLDDLVEYMRGHKTYGRTYIDYKLDEEERPLVLSGVDEDHRDAMSRYFFCKETKWYRKLAEIVDNQILVTQDGNVQFVEKDTSVLKKSALPIAAAC